MLLSILPYSPNPSSIEEGFISLREAGKGLLTVATLTALLNCCVKSAKAVSCHSLKVLQKHSPDCQELASDQNRTILIALFCMASLAFTITQCRRH